MANRVDRAQVETFIVQVLTDFDPDIVVTPETAFYDLFVRFFNLTVIAEILAILQDFEANQSFSNFEADPDTYDLLLDRWFFNRAEGSQTTVTAALAFSEDTAIFTVRPSDLFTINDHEFNPQTLQTVLQNSYEKRITDAGTTEFVVLVPLISVESGSDLTLSIGDTVATPYTNLPNFTRSFVDSELVIGDSAESNAVAFQRLQDQISVQNLINVRSITAVLRDSFPGLLTTLEIIGYLDPEMYRDLISIEIPKRVVRLIYSSKVGVQLLKSHTIFNYSLTEAEYGLLNDYDASSTSEDWIALANGTYALDLELELLSINNPEGFVNDAPISVFINQGSITSPILVNMVTSVEAFVGAHARIDINKVETSDGVSSPVTPVHVGGFTDIYARVPVERTTQTYTIPVGAGGRVEFPTSLQPVLKVHNVVDNNNTIVDLYDLIVSDPTLRFSAEDTTALFVDPGLEGSPVTVELSHASLIQTINNEVNSNLVKVVAEDTIVRFFHPIFVTVFATVSAVSGENNLEAQLRAAVLSYLDSLSNISELPISRVIDVIHGASAFVDRVPTVSVYANQYLPDGTIWRFG
jgi:hypothetical protein